MKLKINYLLPLLFLALTIAQAQETDKYNKIGFTCCTPEKQSKPVGYVSRLILDRKLKPVMQLLFSDNPAENFLAVIACESMQEKGLVVLNKKKLKRIAELYRSKRTISVCSGCFFSGDVTISDLLNKKDSEHIRAQAEQWLDETLGQVKTSTPTREGSLLIKNNL